MTRTALITGITARLERMGWRPGIALDEGIAATWRWFVEHVAVTGVPPRQYERECVLA